MSSEPLLSTNLHVLSLVGQYTYTNEYMDLIHNTLKANDYNLKVTYRKTVDKIAYRVSKKVWNDIAFAFRQESLERQHKLHNKVRRDSYNCALELFLDFIETGFVKKKQE